MALSVRTIKEFLGRPTMYRTKTVKFKKWGEMLTELKPGDEVMLAPGASTIGYEPGAAVKVKSVSDKIVTLVDGRTIHALWLQPFINRTEMTKGRAVADALEHAGWLAEAALVDHVQSAVSAMTDARRRMTDAQENVARAQASLHTSEEEVARLEADAKLYQETGSAAWTADVAERLVSLVREGLYVNFATLETPARIRVFQAYTGPIKDKRLNETREYRVQVFIVIPASQYEKVIIENVTPGMAPEDVPFRERNGSGTNVCFGENNEEMKRLIAAGDWPRALTVIRGFLEGNRKN